MTTAVVILNWNGEALLREFLPSLISYTPNAELIVADNGSSDASLEVLANEFPSIRVIALDQNYGFAKGYNMALKQVEADNYILLNSDVMVTPSWLEGLVKCLESDSKIAACQGKLKKYGAEDTFEYAGAAGGLLDRFCYPYCRGRVKGHVEKDLGQYNTPCRIFWASGACLAVKSSAFWAVGGFDESFFAHMEEIDLCWRLQLAGYTVAYTPESEVYHVGGASLSEGSPFKLYLNFRNNRKMMKKCLPETLGERKARRLLAVRWVLDHAAALVYLVTFRPKYFKAVHDAYMDSRGPVTKPLVQNPDVLPLSSKTIVL